MTTPTADEVIQLFNQFSTALSDYNAAQAAAAAAAPAPAPAPVWTTVAPEWTDPANGTGPGSFTVPAGGAQVRFGAGTAWITQTLAAGAYSCSIATFGGTDPAPGLAKECQILE